MRGKVLKPKHKTQIRRESELQSEADLVLKGKSKAG